MAKKGGIHAYSVQEAQNVTMGQAGVAYVGDNHTYTPPSGSVVVAIQAIDDCVFTTNTKTEGPDFAGPDQISPGSSSGGATISMGTLTIPSGMTIYGRFTAVDFSGSPKAILYLG
jgi:hypothetical protein